MKLKSIAECSPRSILQYFWPALSDNPPWKPFFLLFEWPLKTGFTVYSCVAMDVIYKPFSVGGDSRLSLAARRNLRRVSQVSLVKMADSLATPSIVLRTLWHNRACRFTKSDPKTYHIHVVKFEFWKKSLRCKIVIRALVWNKQLCGI